MLDIVLILIGIIVLFGAGYVLLFNGLVKARQQVKEGWSGIDVQLKRRYDLIPNLVSTVKGYAEHEQETLDRVMAARAKAIAVPAENIASKGHVESELTSALRSIFALAENYPDLKASTNFLELQTQLAETEDQIASARRIYNSNVTAYNVKVHMFPSNLIAKNHDFTEEDFFEPDEAERAAIRETPKTAF